MIRIAAAPVTEADDFTVSGSLIVEDDSGRGIMKVSVLDRFETEVAAESYDGCPGRVEIRVTRISRSRLPLTVRARDCGQQESRASERAWETGAQIANPDLGLPSSALLCVENSACRRAEAEALRARNRVLEQCSRVRSKENEQRAHNELFATLLAAAVALAAAGILAIAFGFGFGAVIGALLLLAAALVAAFAAAEAARAYDAGQEANRLRDQLAALREAFTEAAQRVLEVCSPGCISVDLNQPGC